MISLRSFLWISVMPILLGASVMSYAQSTKTTSKKPDKSAPGKLYRWVGADGKVYYSDQVPPEQMGHARTEISRKTGIASKEVARELTPEERAEAEKQALLETQRLQEKANQDLVEENLVNTYFDEAALNRSFEEQLNTIKQEMALTQLELKRNQEEVVKNLAILGDFELSNKAPPKKRVENIQKLQQNKSNIQKSLSNQTLRLKTVEEDRQKALVVYRSRKAAANTTQN